MKNLKEINIILVADERTKNGQICINYNFETDKVAAYINPNGDFKENLQRILTFLKEREI